MNGRKKLLCVFLLAFFLFCYTSINAFAEDASSAPTPGGSTSQANSENTPSKAPASAADSVPAKPTQGGVSSAAAVSRAPSSAPPPPASSAAPSSRRHYYRSASSSVSSFQTSSIPDFTVSSESSSDVISLPAAGTVSENDPFASASTGVPANQMNGYGILAWVCVGLGILVVLIVILSNRRPPRGPGRSRYHRPKRSGKHLLSDKYYRGLNRY